MSRATWINELVDAGYDAGVLDTLNNNELAELVQEEYTENTWTEAARMARKLHGRSLVRSVKRRTRQSGMSGLLKGKPGTGQSTGHLRKDTLKGQKNRKALASYLKVFKVHYGGKNRVTQ